VTELEQALLAFCLLQRAPFVSRNLCSAVTWVLYDSPLLPYIRTELASPAKLLLMDCMFSTTEGLHLIPGRISSLWFCFSFPPLLPHVIVLGSIFHIRGCLIQHRTFKLDVSFPQKTSAVSVQILDISCQNKFIFLTS